MSKIFDRVEEILALVFLAGTVTAVLVGAVGRSVGVPIPAGPEIAQLLLIWTCMFGADLTIKRGDHIRISALPDALAPRYRRVLIVVSLASILAFLAYVAWLGFQLAMSNWARPMGTSGLSYAWVTLALPVGSVLMIVSLLRRLATHGLLYSLEPEVPDQEYPL
ncbi:TRAP transporter small permease [Ancylobacter sp. MQZ15Z-1]|uniref:TRAP transporter small permease protein n=1 Tax=Ancylobacter mangrovi TaxID=2972472 RepID=A0A9X2T2F0_9HYPH|nr:TRAP transporter small permease [Ancylobacter mangrovi]MCS0495802.1 TRAP transporter small permease [Ancylobacter mangrovi]